MMEHASSFRIERTRNRHSRAVLKEGVIVIRLGKHLTLFEEHRHTESLLRRMQKMLAKHSQKQSITPFRDILNGSSEAEVSLATGRRILYFLEPGQNTSAKRTAAGWKIRIGPHVQRSALHRLLWRALAAEVHDDAQRLVSAINAVTLQVRVRQIRIRLMRTQWGSCSSHGNLTLNAALFVLPLHLLEYVIVHELAHCLHHNHSKKFWHTVEHAYPDYRSAMTTLKNYRMPVM